MTQKAKKGDTVKIEYTGKLDDGTVFDSSEGREPISFELGAGNVIPGFDTAVDGMELGEEKTVNIKPEDAYGEWQQENIIEVPKSSMDADFKPEVGQHVYLKRNDGATLAVTVTKIEEETLTLDANHPLAGQALNFDLKLVEIV